MLRAAAVALLLAPMLFTPATSAGWSTYGAREPDSRHDATGFMFFDPPAPSDHPRVYFNVVTRQTYAPVNSNVGLLGTRIETVVTEVHTGVLGVWRDCNRDGYMGMAETALREYRDELLLDKSVCPVASSWSDFAHNYNGWVTELVPIGTYQAKDGRAIVDREAKVWGDHGLPDGSDQRPSCALLSLPPGSTQTTGRMLDHMDCHLAVIAGTRTSSEYANAIRALDPENALGLHLRDPLWSGEEHPFERETLGDEHGDRAIVEAQDCDQTPLVTTGTTPPGSDLDWETVRGPSTNVRPDGTIAGTVTQLLHSLPSTYRGSSCHYYHGGNEDGAYSLLESGPSDSVEGLKRQASFAFDFWAQARGTGASALAARGSNGAPSDLGVEALDLHCEYLACSSTSWRSAPTMRSPPSVFRGSALQGTLDIAAAYTMTFYAKLGQATLAKGVSLPGDGVAFPYGGEVCGSSTSGVKKGWDCDGSAWSGSIRPGQTYHLRDVDCYDGGVGSTGIGVLPAFYGFDPCPR